MVALSFGVGLWLMTERGEGSKAKPLSQVSDIMISGLAVSG